MERIERIERRDGVEPVRPTVLTPLERERERQERERRRRARAPQVDTAAGRSDSASDPASRPDRPGASPLRLDLRA